MAAAMDQQTIITDIEGRAKALGIPMSEVCKRAGIHPTTFSRWKLSDKNPDPIGATIKSLSAIGDVLNRAEGSDVVGVSAQASAMSPGNPNIISHNLNA